MKYESKKKRGEKTAAYSANMEKQMVKIDRTLLMHNSELRIGSDEIRPSNSAFCIHTEINFI